MKYGMMLTVLCGVLCISVSAEANNLKGTCLHIVSKIAACEPYDCVHVHPDTTKRKEQVRIQILGKTPEGYCHIKQTTTDGAYLECKYTQPSLDAWARIMDYFFVNQVMQPTQEDEETFSSAFKRECLTTPMKE